MNKKDSTKILAEVSMKDLNKAIKKLTEEKLKER